MTDALVDDFLAEFAEQGSVDRWAFSRTEFNIDAGGSIDLVSEGGETHTFTEVAQFGNGCIPLFDDPKAKPAFDCTQFPAGIVGASGVAAGDSADDHRAHARDASVRVRDPSVDALDRRGPRERQPGRPRLPVRARGVSGRPGDEARHEVPGVGLEPTRP